jgi:hypothetical protein
MVGQVVAPGIPNLESEKKVSELYTLATLPPKYTYFIAV